MIFFYKMITKLKWFSILLLIAVSIYSITQIQHLVVDKSFKSLKIKNDPSSYLYDKYKSNFGSDYTAIIYIQDPSIFTNKKMRLLQNLVWDFEELESIEKVDSIFSTVNFKNNNDTLQTTPVIAEVKKTTAQILFQLNLGESNPFVHNKLMNIKNKSILINLKINPNKLMTKVFIQLEKRLSQDIYSNFKIVRQVGDPAIEDYTQKETTHVLFFLLPLLFILIILINFFFTRSIHSSIISIISFFFTISITLAIMIFFKIPVLFLSSIVPMIVFVLNSTEITHMTTEFQSIVSDKLSERISKLFNEIGGAILLTSISTFLGFLSMYYSKIIMLKNFAIVSSIALFFGFFISVTIFNLYFQLIPAKVISHSENIRNKILLLIERFYLKAQFSKRWIYIPYIVLILIFVVFRNIKTENGSLMLISNKSNIKKSVRLIENDYKGINSLYLYFESSRDLRDPEQLQSLYQIQKKISMIRGIQSIDSFASIIALVNREMTSTKLSIPTSKNTIFQYLLSISSDDTKRFISPDFKKGSLVIYHNFKSSKNIKQLINQINAVIQNEKMSTSFRLMKITGKDYLTFIATENIVNSMFYSFIFTMITIFVLISLYFKNIQMGLASLPPNIIPMIFLVIILSVLNIPLNIGTATVCAITLGIAVDDTIHLFIRYSHELKNTSNPHQAILSSMDKEFIPILATTISLVLGFLLLTDSDFIPFAHFGIFTSLLLFVAMLSDLFFTPSIIGALGSMEFLTVTSNEFLVLNKIENLNKGHFSKSDYLNIFKYGHLKNLSPGEYRLNSFIDKQQIIFLDQNVILSKNSERKFEDNQSTQINIAEIPNLTMVDLTDKSGQLFFTVENRVSTITFNRQMLELLKLEKPSTFYTLCDIIYDKHT